MSSRPEIVFPELIAVPLTAVPADKPLRFSVYFKNPSSELEPYSEVVSPKKSLSFVDKARLGLRTDAAYISREAWPTFFSSVGSFKTESTDFIAQLEVARIWSILYSIDSELKGTLERSSFQKQRLLSDWLALSIPRIESTRGCFRRFSNPDLYLANHGFNVAIAAAFVAKRLGFSMEAIKLVTLGSLLHNIGNIEIPKTMLHKTGPLTKPEWDVMKVHPSRGAELLYLVNAPREVILTSMQHHERVDGNGYPELIYGHEIHLFAKICSAVDVFDALKSPRPYEPPMPQELAIEMIVKMEARFEGQILNIVSSIEE